MKETSPAGAPGATKQIPTLQFEDLHVEKLRILGRTLTEPQEVADAKTRIAELEGLANSYRCAIHPNLYGTAPLTFGAALQALKAGHRIARKGWNGKGMWLAFSPGSKALPAERFWAPQNRRHAEEHGPTDVLPCITMKTVTGEILMGWLASQTDMLAEDWTIVE